MKKACVQSFCVLTTFNKDYDDDDDDEIRYKHYTLKHSAIR